MPDDVILAVGHWGIEGITTQGLGNVDIPGLRVSTGAEGERDYIHRVVAPQVQTLLQAAGISCRITGATWDDSYTQDHKLWAALHYNGGGTYSYCSIWGADSPYVNAEAQIRGDQFAQLWCAAYPKATGIQLRQDAVTLDMRQYYGFLYPTYATPSVIIELGNHTCPADSDVMFNHPGRVIDGLVDPIKQYLGVAAQPAPIQGEYKDPVTGGVIQRGFYAYWTGSGKLDTATSILYFGRPLPVTVGGQLQVGEFSSPITRLQTLVCERVVLEYHPDAGPGWTIQARQGGRGYAVQMGWL